MRFTPRRLLFAQHDIRYVVVPVERREKQLPLVARLSTDQDWVNVFRNENAAVFVRKR